MGLAQAADLERAEEERRSRGVTFREVAHAYLRWLEDVAGAKPSTLRDHRVVLGEPGVPYRRGRGVTAGPVMAALGVRPAAGITTREVESLLAEVSGTGASPRTVNKYRNVLSAVFGYGCKPSTYGLPGNPARDADKRREPHPAVLVFYAPEDVKALARAFADGRHRKNPDPEVVLSRQEHKAREAEDRQDAELVRSRRMRGCGSGSCWRCAGGMWTSPGRC